MRILSVLPLTLLAACATQPERMPPMIGTDVPGTVLPSEGIESIRYSENIKAYNVGRYVDPNNRRVMHDAHIVYRVETTAKWNLHPNPGPQLASGPVTHIVDPARREAPLNDEIIAEVHRQKAATQALLEQSARLNQTLQHLSSAAETSQRVTEQNAQLQQELNKTKLRLEALETDRQKTPGQAQQPKPANEDW
jgi:hypothetical protein